MSAQIYGAYVSKVINNWTVIRICQDQESGGQYTGHKINNLISCIPDVIRKLKDSFLVSEFLEGYLDDELNAVCEDESIPFVATLLVDGMKLLKANQLTELRAKLESLPVGCDLNKCQTQPSGVSDESGSSDDGDSEDGDGDGCEAPMEEDC